MASTGIKMPSAKLLVNPESPEDPDSWIIVDAADLKRRVTDENDILEQADVYHKDNIYECKYCDAKVGPVAIGDTPINEDKPIERNPHFANRNGEFHDKEICDRGKEPKPSSRRTTKPDNDVIPLNGYPNRLSLAWLEPEKESLPLGISGKPKGFKAFIHNWSPDKIFSLVTYFLKTLGKGLDLKIPGVDDARGYDRIFQEILFNKTNSLNKLRIYFAEIIYTEIQVREQSYTFYLTDGKRSMGESMPRKRAEITIDSGQWHPVDKHDFDIKVDRLIKDAKQARSKMKPGESKAIPILFFLGHSLSDDNSEFSLLADARKSPGSWKLVDLRVTNKLNEMMAMQHQPIKPEPDYEQLDMVLDLDPLGDIGSLLQGTPDSGQSDDLDERLKEGRRRRAKTFRKVTNLFKKIFGE
ncbi:hypothetical protein ACSYAD_32550 [Acaryochloris marina NIES-2412]|uniref:hypothetical protein n=1 Tax=Acaryochloris marina TaxID=155978 RepID=UPI0040592D3C